VSYVLAIDLGTSGPKVALVGLDGNVLAAAFEPVETQLGPGGAAEQRPQDWWRAIVTCTGRIAAQCPDDLRAAAAVAVTGQWAGTVAVDAAGEPLAPALTWLDSRGAGHARTVAGAGAGGLRVEGYAPQRLARWIRITGGAPSLSGRDPFAHLQFLRHERPQVWEAATTFLEPVDWLNLRLTGVRSASYDTATLHWVTDTRNPTAVRYDERLLALAGLDAERLPPLRPSASVVAAIGARAASELGVGAQAVVVTATPDTMSAAVGSGAVGEHAAHLYVGTSSWLSCHVAKKKTDPFHAIAALPSALPGRYLVSCEQQTAGASLAMVRDTWLAGTPAAAGGYPALTELAAAAEPGSGGVLFCPWLNGERTPVDDHLVRGGWLNLSLDTTQAQLVRSVLEGVALNARWMQQPVERFCGRRLEPLAFIGGGALSPLWAQTFADVLQREIRADADPLHANVRGAAFLAGIALGELTAEDVPARVQVAQAYLPDERRAALYDGLFEEFVKIYKATKPIYARLNRGTRSSP
jgi:xylulokinase